MHNRCRNENEPSYVDYGGRGISVCERWVKFENFLEDMGKRPDGTTIERVDVNGRYEPANCVWADKRTQANNTRSNHRVTHEGLTKTVAQWARHFNIPAWKLHQRLQRDKLSFTEAIIDGDRRYSLGVTL